MLVVVGRIGRPHGVRGAVSIEVRTDEPDRRFFEGARLLSDSGRELTVATVTWHSGRLLLTFEGYPDRTAVEQLRGQVLSVDRPEDERPDDPDEFYDSSLVDCQVFDGAGEFIGVVQEVAHLPAQDMLVIRATTGDGGREILIPFIEEFVPGVDIANKTITVSPPEGLLDEEA